MTGELGGAILLGPKVDCLSLLHWGSILTDTTVRAQRSSQGSSPIPFKSAIRQLSSQRCHIWFRALQRLMEGAVSSLYLVRLADRPAEASESCSLLSTFLLRLHSLLDSARMSFQR